MNILVLSWRGPGHPNAGGAEISTHEHIKGWVQAGHKVTLFTSYFRRAKREEVIDGIEIKRYGRQMLGVQWEAFVWYLFKPHDKFDLVVDQFHGIPFFTPFYIKEAKLAVIQETTRKVWFLNPLLFPFRFIVGMIGYVGEPFIFLFYKNIPFMTGSDSAKKNVMEFGIPEKNIIVIPHGVIIKKPHVLHKSTKITITFLGTLSKDKGIEDALYCFSILNKQGDFNFWIIGKSESDRFQKQLIDLTKKLDIEKNTKFYGFVSQSRKFNLLASSYLLIHPSVREGWGLVVIEAAAVSTPTIGYKVAGLKDSIIDNKTGILTRKNTPEEIAENVLKLVMDQPRYKRMCRNAKKWSNKFLWVTSIKQSLFLLKEVYEKNKGDNVE